MPNKVLILGGRGQIGSSVALDLLKYTQAQVTITGRSTSGLTSHLEKQFGTRLQYQVLDLADEASLLDAIADVDLIVHCAGPFRQRNTAVLRGCIAQGKNYVDVSDDRIFTQAALEHRTAAETAGITAVINTGVFPGISNSLVRQGAEQFDKPEEFHIYYVVAGSGGAGVTVMRTTFLNIQHPFNAWINSRWQQVKPYSDKETIDFPAPFGKCNVYWFDMPESLTLAENFPVKTVTTKFGTSPNIYNILTWITAHWFPKQLMQKPRFIEVLARISHNMASATNRFSGIGVAMRVDIVGQKNGKAAHYYSTFVHDSAAIATGIGTGSICELILSGQVRKPGVWPVEQAITTPLWENLLNSRELLVEQHWI